MATKRRKKNTTTTAPEALPATYEVQLNESQGYKVKYLQEKSSRLVREALDAKSAAESSRQELLKAVSDLGQEHAKDGYTVQNLDLDTLKLTYKLTE